MSRDPVPNFRIHAWLFLVVLLSVSACEEEPAPARSPVASDAPVEEAIRVLVDALEGERFGEVAAVVARSPGDAVRIEIRQTLVETDERTARMLHGPVEVTEWLEESSEGWACEADCRWPRGLVTDGELRCFGDCCDLAARDVPESALVLRRVCLAGRESGERRLSYIGFAEAR